MIEIDKELIMKKGILDICELCRKPIVMGQMVVSLCFPNRNNIHLDCYENDKLKKQISGESKWKQKTN